MIYRAPNDLVGPRIIYCVPLMEDRKIYLLCVPNGDRVSRFIYCVPLPNVVVIGVGSRRFIYCVPLMVDRSGS